MADNAIAMLKAQKVKEYLEMEVVPVLTEVRSIPLSLPPSILPPSPMTYPLIPLSFLYFVLRRADLLHMCVRIHMINHLGFDCAFAQTPS
jgi:hypothetical protein